MGTHSMLMVLKESDFPFEVVHEQQGTVAMGP